MLKTSRLIAALIAALMLAVAGCGSDDGDEGGGEAPDAEKAGQAKASGDLTWCIGKDTSGAFGTVIDVALWHSVEHVTETGDAAPGFGPLDLS